MKQNGFTSVNNRKFPQKRAMKQDGFVHFGEKDIQICFSYKRSLKNYYMTGKTSKHFAFEVSLNWLADTKGILSARDANGTIHIGTPPAFGGEGKPWTPEHLFLASISSCFM